MLRVNKEFVARFQSLIAPALMVPALSLMSDKFLTVDNGLNVLRQISINLCLSIGMTLVILSGGIDLSVGSVLALSGAVAAGLLKNGLALAPVNTLLHHWFGVTFAWFDVVLQFTVFGAIVAGRLVGLVLGWFSGWSITRFGLPPFVATLGMLSIARGLTMLWTGGFPITGLGDAFGFLGTGYFLRVPMPVWICAALVLVFVVATRRTTFGRHL
jgi:ribose transport system permease protein